MNFLERLAPAATDRAPGALRPLLPARFAAPSAASPRDADAAAGHASARFAGRAAHAAVAAVDGGPQRDATLLPPAPAPSGEPAWPSNPSDDGRDRPPQAVSARTAPLHRPPAGPGHDELERRTSPSMPAPATLQQTAPRVSPRADRRAVAARDATGLERPAPPLDAGRVAAQRPAPPPPAPAIHVTIDRLEVRAPAAPRPGGPARAPRATAPASSLADYLRARDGSVR